MEFEIVNRGLLCFVRIKSRGVMLFESKMYCSHSSAKRMVWRLLYKLGSEHKPVFKVVND